MPLWIAIALAGAAGATLRFGLAQWLVQRGATVSIAGVQWPLAIVAVNTLGCLLAGLSMGLLESKWQLSDQLTLVLLVGFLGSLTTFSAFAVDTLSMLRQHGLLAALLQVMVHNGIAIGACLLGYWLGR